MEHVDVLWLRDTGGNYQSELIAVLHANASCLKEFRLKWDGVTSAQLTEMASTLKGAEVIDALCENAYFDEDTLCALAPRCPQLKFLYPVSPHITDRAVLALARHCPFLYRIFLHECNLVTEDALLEMVQRTKVNFTNGLMMTVPVVLSKDARDRVSAAQSQKNDGSVPLSRFEVDS